MQDVFDTLCRWFCLPLHFNACIIYPVRVTYTVHSILCARPRLSKVTLRQVNEGKITNVALVNLYSGRTTLNHVIHVGDSTTVATHLIHPGSCTPYRDDISNVNLNPKAVEHSILVRSRYADLISNGNPVFSILRRVEPQYAR